MNLNKDPESWARIKPEAIVENSKAQVRNLLEWALQDIARMADELTRLQIPPGASAMKMAARAYGFVTMPDRVTLFPRQIEIIENVARLVEQREAAAVTAFATAILHGDEKHRQWLKDAAEAFVAGRPLPAPAATPPIPEGYILVTDGTTQEGDILVRTNTGNFVEEIVQHLRPINRAAPAASDGRKECQE
jgi:hypothetical protein